jgi:hypothetical protein
MRQAAIGRVLLIGAIVALSAKAAEARIIRLAGWSVRSKHREIVQ